MTYAAQSRTMPSRTAIKHSARGIVLLALLLTLVLMSIAVLRAAEWWSVARQREAEADLLYVGDQYRKAIEHFYYASPTPVRTLPTQLEDLLEDPRFPVPVRHLRRLYPDPITGGPFVVLHAGAAVVGVVSSSEKAPVKRSGFPAPYGAFEGQESYAHWQFLFKPPLGPRAAAQRPAIPGGPRMTGVRK